MTEEQLFDDSSDRLDPSPARAAKRAREAVLDMIQRCGWEYEHVSLSQPGWAKVSKAVDATARELAGVEGSPLPDFAVQGRSGRVAYVAVLGRTPKNDRPGHGWHLEPERVDYLSALQSILRPDLVALAVVGEAEGVRVVDMDAARLEDTGAGANRHYALIDDGMRPFPALFSP